ncbi:MAG: hypothetical protein OEW42_17210, partial [Acidimicrobiia bacterium]|nr:hypothetical protein [Acidimicrobiia bacterium]
PGADRTRSGTHTSAHRAAGATSSYHPTTTAAPTGHGPPATAHQPGQWLTWRKWRSPRWAARPASWPTA